jgi:L-amino acid N-acyltransferase
MREARIRAVVPGDLAQILEIYNREVLHSDTTLDTKPKDLTDFEAWYTEHSAPYSAAVVESEPGVIAGYGALSPFARRGGYFPLAEVSIYLGSTHRGRGYGSSLSEWLVEEARRQGFTTLVGFLTVGNEPSVRMLLRAGYVHVGRMSRVGYKLGRYIDLDIYQLFLRGAESGPPPVPGSQPSP